MLYPNKAQWWVIWIVAVLAFLFLVNGAVEVAFGLVALGCLLVWQLSRLRKRPEERTEIGNAIAPLQAPDNATESEV